MYSIIVLSGPWALPSLAFRRAFSNYSLTIGLSSVEGAMFTGIEKVLLVSELRRVLKWASHSEGGMELLGSAFGDPHPFILSNSFQNFLGSSSLRRYCSIFLRKLDSAFLQVCSYDPQSSQVSRTKSLTLNSKLTNNWTKNCLWLIPENCL